MRDLWIFTLREQPEGSRLYQECWFNRGEKQPELPDSKWEQFLGMSPGVNGNVVSGQTGIGAGLIIYCFAVMLICAQPGVRFCTEFMSQQTLGSAGCACTSNCARGFLSFPWEPFPHALTAPAQQMSV